MSSSGSGRISAAAKTARQQWEDEAGSARVRDYSFNTVSGQSVDLLYLPPESDDDYLGKWGFPGQYPFTRGAYPNMYRGRLWTMRQFAGFGTPEETNERYKFLLKHGQTGLSVAYDMPTLMGYDADDACSLGEVGRCGVNVSSLEDMETLFDGIDLGSISVSQTINGPAFILLAFYVAVAEKQGIPRRELTGTLQADIEMNAISPEVNVVLVRQRTLRPISPFVPPAVLQPNNISRRQPFGVRAQQALQGLGEVACADAFEIEPGYQLLDTPGSSQIRRQNLAGEAYGLTIFIDSFVIDAGLVNLDSTDTRLNRPARQISISHNQPVSASISQTLAVGDVLCHFVLNGRSQHLLCSLPENIRQNISACH